MALHFLDIIREVSPAERKKFEEYLYFAHKNEKKALSTWEFIRPIIGTKKAIDEVALYCHVFGKPPKDSLKPIQNQFHDLKKILLDFFTWQELRSQGDNRESLLLRIEALRKRGMTSLYLSQIEKAQKDRTKPRKNAVWNVIEDWMLLHHHYYFAIDHSWERRNEDLKKLIHTVDTLYVAMQWQYRSEWRSQQKVMHSAADDLNPESLEQFTRRLGTPTPAPAALFHDLYRLLETDDEAGFQVLLQLYESQVYATEEQLILLMALINFKVRQLHNNQPEAQKEIFELYKSGLERDIFLASGFFPAGPFHNIVTVACILKEFDWALHFIQEKSPQLPPKEQENIRQLSLAKVCFEQKQFEPAMDILQKVNINNMADSLQFRLLRIRIYYELTTYHDLMKKECTNLTQYVNNNGSLSVKKEYIKIFCRIMQYLVDGKKTRAQLENLLSEYPEMIYKGWLQEKINAVP